MFRFILRKNGELIGRTFVCLPCSSHVVTILVGWFVHYDCLSLVTHFPSIVLCLCWQRETKFQSNRAQ